MALLERCVMKVKQGKWDAFKEWEAKFKAIEQRTGGFPIKKYYHAISGPYDIATIVWEREWESFSAREAINEKQAGDPDITALFAGEWPVASIRFEFYDTVDLD